MVERERQEASEQQAALVDCWQQKCFHRTPEWQAQARPLAQRASSCALAFEKEALVEEPGLLPQRGELDSPWLWNR